MHKRQFRSIALLLTLLLAAGTAPVPAAEEPAEAATAVVLQDRGPQDLTGALGELGELAEPMEEETEGKGGTSSGLDLFGGFGSSSNGLRTSSRSSPSGGNLIALDNYGISIQVSDFVSIHQIDDSFVCVYPLYDQSVPFVAINGCSGRYDEINGFTDECTQSLRASFSDVELIESASNVSLGNHTFTRIIHQYTFNDVLFQDTRLFCAEGGNTYLFASTTANDYGYTLPSGYLESIAGGFAYLTSGSGDYPYHVNDANSVLYPSSNAAPVSATTKKPASGESYVTDEGITVRPSESSQIQLADYDDGWVSMKIPQGWNVYVGGTVETFAIRIVDPNDDRNQIFRYVQQNYAETEASEQIYRRYGTELPYLQEPTVEGVIRMQNNLSSLSQIGLFAQAYAYYEFPCISNLNVIERYDTGETPSLMNIDPTIIRASFNNGNAANGGECEGLFSANITNPFRAAGAELRGYGIPEDPNLYNLTGTYTVFFTTGISAAKEEFINYEPILLECIDSMQYSQKFVDLYMETSNNEAMNALEIGRQLNQASQDYNDAWFSRQTSYDIISQKQSDATMGYERVYDTEKGEIYKANNGFLDVYDGERYVPVTDSQYTEPVAGYIDW